MNVAPRPLHVVFSVYNANAPGSVNDITRRQAEHLAREGCQVTLLTDREGVSWKGVHTQFVPAYNTRLSCAAGYFAEGFSRRLPPALERMSLKNIVKQMQFPHAAAGAAAEIATRQPVNGVVACQHVLAFGLKKLKRQFGIPFIVVSHGDIFEHPSDSYSAATNWLYRRAARETARQADKVIAVSHRLRERTISIGALPGRVEVVYNGIDRSDITCGDNERASRGPGLELLSVGRLGPEKGVDVLIRSLPLLKIPQLRLRIVGDGPERTRLEQLAEKLNVGHQVEFLGQLRREQIGRYYEVCDIVVLPSRSDAMPLVSLEAMMMGRPLVGTLVGGVPEIVEQGMTGLLVAPDDPQALAGAINQLDQYPELREKMGIAASERSRLFAWPKLLEQFEGIVRREFSTMPPARAAKFSNSPYAELRPASTVAVD